MNKHIERAKWHFVRNKTSYIVGAGCLFVGAAGTLVFTQRVSVAQTAKNIALLQWKPLNYLEQTTVIQLPARGHRGLVLLNNETGTVYASQREAARELGTYPTIVAKHLKGDLPTANGTTLTSLGENLSEQVKVTS